MTKHGTNRDHNTHTHTNLKRELMVSVPNNNNKSLLWLHGPTLDQLLKTSPAVATTNINSEKQSPTVSVYPLGYAIWRVGRLLKTGNFRFRHDY